MFAYMRYFSALAAVVIIIGAFMVGMAFRGIAEGDVKSLSERSHIALAQGYKNTVWKKHRGVLAKLNTLPVKSWQEYREFVAFAEDTYHYFEGTPIAEVTLYTKQGTPFLSVLPPAKSSQDVIHYNLSKRPDADAFNAVKVGETVTLLSPATDEGASGVVQTICPMLPEGYVSVVAGGALRLEGAIELSTDVTPQLENVRRFQIIVTGGIIFIFTVLVAVLFFTARRAETIISKQHEINLELTAAASAAQAENQAKSQFLANISHELRTPLNAIIGFSEIIKNEVMGRMENVQYQEYIKDIHASGVHLLSLINDILDYSKAEVGKLELDVNEVDATKIILNCLRLVSPRAEQAQVALVDELPSEHFVLLTDAKKLKQIMLNLLSNAVKFTPSGGKVFVSAWKNAGEDSISIEVRDTGIGIAPKDISRAMAPFGQVDSALSRKYEGTGLGLPLTRRFVELMGGEFQIKSEPGQGTVIIFTLPNHGPESDGETSGTEAPSPA